MSFTVGCPLNLCKTFSPPLPVRLLVGIISTMKTTQPSTKKLPDFEAAVENGRRLRELLTELTEAAARDILSSAQPLKKKLAEIALKGAEALLPIRALYKSGRLDEFHNWRVKDLAQVAFDAA